MCVCVCVCAKLLQSCPILCDPTDCSPPSSSVHGILQVRMLEWAAIPTSRRSSQHRDGTVSDISSALARRFLTTSTTWDTRNIKYTYTYLCVCPVCVCVCMCVKPQNLLYSFSYRDTLCSIFVITESRRTRNFQN